MIYCHAYNRTTQTLKCNMTDIEGCVPFSCMDALAFGLVLASDKLNKNSIAVFHLSLAKLTGLMHILSRREAKATMLISRSASSYNETQKTRKLFTTKKDLKSLWPRLLDWSGWIPRWPIPFYSRPHSAIQKRLCRSVPIHQQVVFKYQL